MKKCNRPYCDNPATESIGGRKKLCKQHAAERKQRQFHTASLPDCTRCNNKAKKGDFLCGACREHENQLYEVQQEEMQLHNDRLRIQTLEERVFQLEAEIRQLKQ